MWPAIPGSAPICVPLNQPVFGVVEDVEGVPPIGSHSEQYQLHGRQRPINQTYHLSGSRSSVSRIVGTSPKAPRNCWADRLIGPVGEGERLSWLDHPTKQSQNTILLSLFLSKRAVRAPRSLWQDCCATAAVANLSTPAARHGVFASNFAAHLEHVAKLDLT
jgi:hypothetical protein